MNKARNPLDMLFQQCEELKLKNRNLVSAMGHFNQEQELLEEENSMIRDKLTASDLRIPVLEKQIKKLDMDNSKLRTKNYKLQKLVKELRDKV